MRSSCNAQFLECADLSALWTGRLVAPPVDLSIPRPAEAGRPKAAASRRTPNWRTTFLLTALAGLALTPVSRAEEKLATKIESAYAEISSEMGPVGQRIQKRGKVWKSGAKMRAEFADERNQFVQLRSGDTCYIWRIGDTEGLRCKVQDAEHVDPMRRFVEVGKPLGAYAGAEQVNGVMCDIYKNKNGNEFTKSWFSQEDKLLKKLFIKDGEEQTMLVTVTRFEANPKLGDKLFELPEGVGFLKNP